VKVEQLESDPNPWTLYLYAMKSPVTRDKYQKRLGKFFDFIRLEGGSVEEKSRVTLVKYSKRNPRILQELVTLIEPNLGDPYIKDLCFMTYEIVIGININSCKTNADND
jgi:hypothetical protein